MIDDNLKEQFIATATRAWGLRAPGNNDHMPGEDLTRVEARKHYVVPDVTFSIDDVSVEGEQDKVFGRGQGTHRAYLLYRLMRKDQEQLAIALQQVRSVLRLGKAKKDAYKIIADALKGRE